MRGQLQRWRHPGIPHQCAHVIAGGRERARQVAAREPGRAGDEHYHRSATIVTGDPNSAQQTESLRQRPARAPRNAAIRSPCARQSAARTADAPNESESRPSAARRPPLAVAQHAVRLGARADAMDHAAADRLEQRRTARRRIVDDHRLGRHAAQLRETALPVGGVHQHAQADDDVERPIGELEPMRIADGKPNRERCLGRSARAIASISSDGSTAVTRPPRASHEDRGPAGPRADVQNRPISNRAGESIEHVGLRRRDQLADRSAEAPLRRSFWPSPDPRRRL